MHLQALPIGNREDDTQRQQGLNETHSDPDKTFVHGTRLSCIGERAGGDVLAARLLRRDISGVTLAIGYSQR